MPAPCSTSSRRAASATHTLTPLEARAFYRDRRSFTQPAAPEMGGVRDTHCEGPRGRIPLRVYRPAGAGAAPARGSTLPALVYFHGGGWASGWLDTHDVLCRRLCNGAGAIVVAVDYRIGPEHPFPAAVDDAGRDALGPDARTRPASTPTAWRSAATARARTSPPSSHYSRATPATCRSRRSCCAIRPPTCGTVRWPPSTDATTSSPARPSSATSTSTSTTRRATSTGEPRRSMHADLAGCRARSSSPPNSTPCATKERSTPIVSSTRATARARVLRRQIHGFITMGKVIDEANSAVGLCAAEVARALAR